MTISNVYKLFSQQLLTQGGLDVLRLVQTPVGDLSTSWLFKNEPLIISKRLRLAYHNPLWPPDNFSTNFGVLIGSMAGRRPAIAAIAPCNHHLPSWVLCLSCSSAPTLALPDHFRVDAGFDGTESNRVTFSGDLLCVFGVLIDTVTSLSAFHAREHDEQYPVDAQSSTNAYGDKAATQEALWRSLLAGIMFEQSPVTKSYRDVLLSCASWTAAPIDRLYGMAYLQYGLPEFLRRNKDLVLCGHTLKDLLLDNASGYHNARTISGKTEDEIEAFEVISRATNLLAWRRLIATREGRIGLATASARQGDRVVVLKGCGMPMLLRPIGNYWKVVGECYLHGCMQAGIAQTLRKSPVVKLE